MAVQVITTQSPGGRDLVDLPISFSGMTLTVGAGPFTAGGEDYTLAEDFEYKAIAPPAGVSWLEVYLVRVKEDGRIRVLVADHVPADGEEPFAFQDSVPWEHLHLLAVLAVPAGTVSLADVETQHRRVVAPEEES